MREIDFKYGINVRPQSKFEHLLLSLQHVFAMFGSTILVPRLVGLDPSVSLLTAGIGTLIYSQISNKKVPMFIGSSFAFIAIMSTMNETSGANGVANVVMLSGALYMILSLIVKITGVNLINKLLPNVVVGPVIMVIGLSLAPVAVANSGFSAEEFNYSSVIIAMTTLLTVALVLLKGRGNLKLIPIIIGIIAGYLMGLLIQMITGEQIIDLSLILKDGWIGLPDLKVPYLNYDFHFMPNVLIMVLPLVFVTVAEHIGEHTVSSTIMGKDFLKDPGLSKTLLGDGLATFVAGLLGGPVNTTYAENTGVIILTKVASVHVIRLAAMIAMALSFMKPLIGFINSIPLSVMGGVSIILFGLIAQNGIRLLMNSGIDITHSRNMIIIATILVLGIGNATFSFFIGNMGISFQGMSLAAIVGIVLHCILPDKQASL